MSNSLRSSMRRLAPTRLKEAVWSLRETVASPPIDDAVLAQYELVPETVAGARLNLVIPNLSRSAYFGGVKTGLDIFLELARALATRRKLAVRLILTDPTRETDETIFTDAVARGDGFNGDVSVHRITSDPAKIPVKSGDVFTAFNWWGALNIKPLIKAQADHFALPIRPLLYLIQEYEPHLRAFSSANVLAREALDSQARLWGIFNSSNLHAYFKRQGHKAEKSWVFEPVIHEKLRPSLSKVSESKRARRILVYGRPSIERNCFPALMRGLKRWANEYPGAQGWEVISAGNPHKPYQLTGDIALQSVGKLDIEDYAQMLLTSSVGISLMASCHPSYPPLEMAHFGMRTITNTYADKDLAQYHPNIVSIASIGEVELAQAIAACCERHGQPVSADANPQFVRDTDYPFLDDLVDALEAELQG